jgi:hypothetical protein
MDALLSPTARQSVDVAERFADVLCGGAAELRAAITRMTSANSDEASLCAIQAVHVALYAPENIDLYTAEGQHQVPFPFIPYAPVAFREPENFAILASTYNVWAAAAQSPPDPVQREPVLDAEFRAHALILLDVVGNPFRPTPTVDLGWLAWRGGTVPQLARAAYDERRPPGDTLDPARLALLADALEDAGCHDAEILGHLRGPGPHVRGCWAVDLLLNKS